MSCSRSRRIVAALAVSAAMAPNAYAADAPLAEVATTPAQTIQLAAGTAREVSFAAEIESAFVAEPETADVVVLDNRTLFVLGKSPGFTTLSVHAGGDRVGAYAVRVDASPEHAEAVVERIVGDEASVEVETVGAVLYLSGTAESPAEAERLLRSVEAVSTVPVVDALAVETPPQVNLEVLISEVSRNVTRELGIDWSIDINPFVQPLLTWATGTGIRLGTGALQLADTYEYVVNFGDPNAAGGAALDSNQGAEIGTQSNPRGGEGGIALAHMKEINSSKYRATTFLEALAQNGLLTVHARPNLTTVSGQPAEFFSGLEIPIPSITDRGIVGTVYRQTGVSLVFTPTVLGPDQISLAVQPRIREVAAGGATIAGAVVPNINERSASATVELGNGESIAIAGLYSRNATATEAGIPLLKDIPVWGALFRNATETDRSVELIIVATARIVAAAATPAPRAVADSAESALQLENAFYY